MPAMRDEMHGRRDRSARPNQCQRMRPLPALPGRDERPRHLPGPEAAGARRGRSSRMTPLVRLPGEGFRAFFLAAGLYAVLAIGLWTLSFLVPVPLPEALPPVEWHAHEMIFGYGAAALGGFLLTAVPNWTGAKSARHAFIASAVGLWLAGRIAVWCADILPLPLVAAVDLAFLPLLAAKIATQLVRRPKPQNVMFLGLLALIWTANLFVHLEW